MGPAAPRNGQNVNGDNQYWPPSPPSAAWLGLVPAATADSVDVAYVNGLTAHGITASILGPAFTRAAAIQLGYAICSDLRALLPSKSVGLGYHSM